MEEKQLRKTQSELLHIRQQNIIMAQNIFMDTVKQIAKELDIPETEKWTLSDDFTKLTKVVLPKKNIEDEEKIK